MDERYGLEQRIDHVTNETLDATRRIRQVAEETNQIGVDTLVTLNEQGEQLDKVEDRLDEIQVDLQYTDKNLTELEKCCGCCTCPCGRAPNIRKNKVYKKAYGKKAVSGGGVVTEQPSSDYRPYGGQDQGPYIKKITDDAREDEMEDNLQAVAGVLTNLKGMAGDMGEELDKQNVQIDRLNRKMDGNNIHLDQANRRIRRQL